MKVIFNHVNKSFGGKKVLSDCSFKAEIPGIYAVKGVSGSGKTTLMRIIAKLERQDEGEITVQGSIAFSFQEARLFPHLTVLSNVCVSNCSKKEASEILAKLNLKEAENLKPAALSGGMAKRVNFARAIMAHPDILILDEPFEGQDEANRLIIKAIIQREAQNRIVFVSDHTGVTFENCKNYINL